MIPSCTECSADATRACEGCETLYCDDCGNSCNVCLAMYELDQLEYEARIANAERDY